MGTGDDNAPSTGTAAPDSGISWLDSCRETPAFETDSARFRFLLNVDIVRVNGRGYQSQ